MRQYKLHLEGNNKELEDFDKADAEEKYNFLQKHKSLILSIFEGDNLTEFIMEVNEDLSLARNTLKNRVDYLMKK